MGESQHKKKLFLETMFWKSYLYLDLYVSSFKHDRPCLALYIAIECYKCDLQQNLKMVRKTVTTLDSYKLYTNGLSYVKRLLRPLPTNGRPTIFTTLSPKIDFFTPIHYGLPCQFNTCPGTAYRTPWETSPCHFASPVLQRLTSSGVIRRATLIDAARPLHAPLLLCVQNGVYTKFLLKL